MITVSIKIREFKRERYITWASKISYYENGEKIKTSIISKDATTQDLAIASMYGVIDSIYLVNNSDYKEVESIEISANGLVGVDNSKYDRILERIHKHSLGYKINIIGIQEYN